MRYNLNMGWKIINIEHAYSAKVYLDNLLITEERGNYTIPLNDIDTLIINSYKLMLSGRVISKAIENNINIIICNEKHIPVGQLINLNGHFKTLKIFEAQLNWKKSFKMDFWKSIIANKIRNQQTIIRKINPDSRIIELFNKYIAEIKSGDVTNREGHAAKVYFNAVFENGFRRFNEDQINSVLNYGYTILRSYVCRSIIQKGLDPRISFFHKSQGNFYALASDLMEPFRPFVDWWVLKNFNQNFLFTSEIKKEIIKHFNSKVKIGNKEYFISNAIDLLIDNLINKSEYTEIILNEL